MTRNIAIIITRNGVQIGWVLTIVASVCAYRLERYEITRILYLYKDVKFKFKFIRLEIQKLDSIIRLL